MRMPPNKAINRTVQQQRFACCWPAAYCRRSASCAVGREISARGMQTTATRSQRLGSRCRTVVI